MEAVRTPKGERMKTETIIAPTRTDIKAIWLAGSVKAVFGFWRLLAANFGERTIGELVK